HRCCAECGGNAGAQTPACSGMSAPSTATVPTPSPHGCRSGNAHGARPPTDSDGGGDRPPNRHVPDAWETADARARPSHPRTGTARSCARY
ncbi:hypothetical protein ABTL24_19485, partial [Acinetobacter baumannii]